MGVNRHRNYLFAVLGLGAAALIVDRAVLQPSAAEATPGEARPAASAAEAEAPPPGAPRPPASVPALAEQMAALEPPPVTPDIFKADPAEWGLPAPGRDSAPSPEASLRLGAIMNADAGNPDASASCAVINSRIVHVGATVAGFVVERITPTSVHLRRGAETRELRMAR